MHMFVGALSHPPADFYPHIFAAAPTLPLTVPLNAISARLARFEVPVHRWPVYKRIFGDLTVHLTPDLEKPGPLVVLLHGFGAPGTDLVGLAPELELPGVQFAFPEAPINLGDMFGMDARAWWMVNVAEIQQAIARNQLDQLAEREPPELSSARAKLDQCLGEIVAHLRPTKIVLGGFSQGAMLATDYLLSNTTVAQHLDALIILSGTVLAEPRWDRAMASVRNRPVFLSHGARDPILPSALARKLLDKFKAHQWTVTESLFIGGHEIPGKVMSDLANFLDTGGLTR